MKRQGWNMADIWQPITTLPTPFRSADGAEYRVTVEGIERPDRTWAGRVVFDGRDGRLATGQETSQPNRQALEYWATGLETIYLEGAFTRASEERSYSASGVA